MSMTPIGWLAVYDDGVGGEVIYRSTGGKSPKDLPRAGCLGVRIIYAETVSIDNGPDIHYSDIWVGWNWVVFYEDGRNVWRARNSGVNNSKGKEEEEEGRKGTLVEDTRWKRVLRERFLNNDDNRVGQW